MSKDRTYLAKTFLKSRGVEVQHSVLIDLIAQLDGHKNHQTKIAVEKKIGVIPRAPFAQENASEDVLLPGFNGSGFRLNPKVNDVWVAVDNADVHIVRTDEGVVVDVWPAQYHGFQCSPDATTYSHRRELSSALLEEVSEDPDGPLSVVVELCKERGIEVVEDVDQPGMWIWKFKNEACESSFQSAMDAWISAYEEVY